MLIYINDFWPNSVKLSGTIVKRNRSPKLALNLIESISSLGLCFASIFVGAEDVGKVSNSKIIPIREIPQQRNKLPREVEELKKQQIGKVYWRKVQAIYFNEFQFCFKANWFETDGNQSGVLCDSTWFELRCDVFHRQFCYLCLHCTKGWRSNIVPSVVRCVHDACCLLWSWLVKTTL